jgi:hypothetical protein
MGYRAIRYCKMDPTMFLHLETLRRRRVIAIIMLLINIITHCTVFLLLEARSDPEPYHTSILTGAGWLMELLLGHPNRIRCELGVRKHVFEALVNELRSMGCHRTYGAPCRREISTIQ